MDISSYSQDKETILALSGRFDFTAHREFRSQCDAALNTPGIQKVVLNMQRVDYLDSSALGMLLLLNEKAKALNAKVVISQCQPGVQQILEIANFNKLFTIV